MKFEKKPVLMGIGATVAFGAIWFGFDHTSGVITDCAATVSTYVTAEYSETVTETSTDADGNLVTTTSTNYWSNLASEVYTTTTVTNANGQSLHVNHDFDNTLKYSAYYPPMPEYDRSLSNDFHFYNFKFHTDASITVYSELIDGTSTKFSDTITKNTLCINNIDSYAIIKTWYGITYSSDF